MKILRKPGLLLYYGRNPEHSEDVFMASCCNKRGPHSPPLHLFSCMQAGNGETEKTVHFSKATGKSFRGRGWNAPPANSSLRSLPCSVAGHCVLCH